LRGNQVQTLCLAKQGIDCDLVSEPAADHVLGTWSCPLSVCTYPYKRQALSQHLAVLPDPILDYP
jgi:hypothetical protein